MWEVGHKDKNLHSYIRRDWFSMDYHMKNSMSMSVVEKNGYTGGEQIKALCLKV